MRPLWGHLIPIQRRFLCIGRDRKSLYLLLFSGKIAEETSDNIDPAYFESFSSVFPTYQITLTVDNMSQIHQTTPSH